MRKKAMSNAMLFGRSLCRSWNESDKGVDFNLIFTIIADNLSGMQNLTRSYPYTFIALEESKLFHDFLPFIECFIPSSQKITSLIW
jgi:hypothetical protein